MVGQPANPSQPWRPYGMVGQLRNPCAAFFARLFAGASSASARPEPRSSWAPPCSRSATSRITAAGVRSPLRGRRAEVRQFRAGTRTQPAQHLRAHRYSRHRPHRRHDPQGGAERTVTARARYPPPYLAVQRPVSTRASRSRDRRTVSANSRAFGRYRNARWQQRRPGSTLGAWLRPGYIAAILRLDERHTLASQARGRGFEPRRPLFPTRMRVLFTTRGSSGHVGPLAPFAQACLRARHDVLVSAQRQFGGNVERLGLPRRSTSPPAMSGCR